MQKIKKLEWDSNFFGYNIGMLDIQDCDFNHLHINQQFDLIYLFSDIKQHSGILPRYIDLKINYKKEATFINEMPKNVKVYQDGLNDRLLSLAILSGHHSRFKKDTRLSSNFIRLYTLWVENSLKGLIADMVLVHMIDFDIKGFLTLQDESNYVQIGLIAVDPRYWGKGIGSSLLNSIAYMYPNKEILVSTQKENKGAAALYEKNGFYINTKKFIYHLWK